VSHTAEGSESEEEPEGGSSGECDGRTDMVYRDIQRGSVSFWRGAIMACFSTLAPHTLDPGRYARLGRNNLSSLKRSLGIQPWKEEARVRLI
jgi:hypothetical protein